MNDCIAPSENPYIGILQSNGFSERAMLYYFSNFYC